LIPTFSSALISASSPISRPPDKKDESGNHSRDDKHPVLNVETEKADTLNEKSHRRRSFFLQSMHLCGENILFLYCLNGTVFSCRMSLTRADLQGENTSI
jgi:hypothetical protein